MLDKVRICGENRQTGTFSKHDWTDIRKQFHKKFRLKYSLKSFKKKFTKLKEKYKDHKKLVEDNTGLGWDPVLCTVEASNEWWDEQVKNFPRTKVFRVSGCPEYRKLQTIFGDTVATGNLRQTQEGGFSSTDGEDEIDMTENGSPTQPLDTQVFSNGGVTADRMEENVDFRRRSQTPSGSHRSTHVPNDSGDVAGEMEENVDNQFRSRSRTPISSRRGRKENKANEIGESLKMLAENAKAKLEDKTKYTISEFLEILDSMGAHVGRHTYVKAVKVLQNQGWRETFIKMSKDRRDDWIVSIQDGTFD
ncbi:uncharacterized protein LOC113312199 [Papaver somniferum]|uniref:uncharacterized protein LOC113312199 n=1 Tax=Papaver somniferum TaxID=3469 RepID=UPI000E6F92E7|nr:uncharacterized protein LOC113312199 [Papaver somniferum]